MASDASKVRVGLTGAISKAPYGTAGPADVSTALGALFVDSGLISTEGVTLGLPDSGDKTPVKAWQGDEQVRVLRTSSDDLPTISFTFLETNKTSVETYFSVTVTQTATEGSFEYSPSLPTPSAYVLDVIDEDSRHRYDIPRGVKASVGDLVYKNDEPVGYQVTLEMEKDATKGYNFKSWMTDLATA